VFVCSSSKSGRGIEDDNFCLSRKLTDDCKLAISQPRLCTDCVVRLLTQITIMRQIQREYLVN